MAGNYKKISKINGFDSQDLNNGRQNNYAWSISELGDYIYVGTGRNLANIIQNSLNSLDINSLDLNSLGINSKDLKAINIKPEEIKLPKEFISTTTNMCGEIWRYKKDGSCPWERVYKASETSEMVGFRSMISYTTQSGDTSLYACCYNMNPKILILKSSDGTNWSLLDTGISEGNSSRTMIIHNGKIYMSIINEKSTSINTLIYCSGDPEFQGWQLMTSSEIYNNPRGQAASLCSFNGHLYAGTVLPYGFEVWRTEDTDEEPNGWKRIVDKGAGDASNVVPLTMEVFKNHLYIGTAAHITKEDGNSSGNLPLRGFDLIRVDESDKWELVAGSRPLIPSDTVTGKRSNPLSGLASGFGEMANAFCWQLKEFNNELYLSTFDWSILGEPIYSALLENKEKLSKLPENKTLKFLVNNPFIVKLFLKAQKNTYGFDLWKSKDGVHWNAVNINGFGNPHNNGIRSLFVSSEGNLYLGTSNLFEGCEVWVKE